MNNNLDAANIGRIVSRVAALLPAAHVAISGIGATVALAPSANAAIIHSSAVNVFIPLTTAGIYINVMTGVSDIAPGNAPGWDINPYGGTSLNWFQPLSPTGGVYVRLPGSAAGTVSSLDAGHVLSANSTFDSGVSPTTGVGAWTLNSLNYFGFRFIGEDSQLRYGWGAVLLGSSFSDPDRKVVDLYYEDVANTGIAVADTGSTTGVPEPTTALLLAGGFVGLMAFRRRNKQSS